MEYSESKNSLTNSIILMRLFIGWHFLFEGVIKWYNPHWTAKGYLLGSDSFLSPFFHWLASDSLIGIVNMANSSLLFLVGIFLLLGIFEKQGAVAGMILLAFYYLAQPAFPWSSQVGVEGNYWLINKNLIELSALWVIYQHPTGRYFGLDRLFNQPKLKTQP